MPPSTQADVLKNIEALALPNEAVQNREYLYYLELEFDYRNVSKHSEFYTAIYNTVHASLLVLNTTKKNGELREVVHDLAKVMSVENISHLWALEIFKYFSTKQSGYIFSAESVLTTTAGAKVFTMLEVVDVTYKNIQTKLDLLFVLGQLPKPINRDLVLKKHLHILMHQLCINYPAKVAILTKKMADIVPTETFLKIKLKDSGEFLEKRDSFVKLMLIVIYLEFEENLPNKFNVYYTPAKIIARENIHVVVGPFLPIANSLIVQKLNKERTTITEQFTTSLAGLTTTGFVVNNNLVRATTELVLAELEQLQDQLLALYNSISAVEFLENNTHIDPSVLKTINNLINLQKINDYKRNFIEKKLVTQIQEFDKNYKEVKTVKDFFNSTKELDSLRAWASSLWKKRTLEKFLKPLQKIFSRMQIIGGYLLYTQFLEIYAITKCYFSVFSDFRGRLYYQSPVSVQSYWCFRYLYTFGPRKVERTFAGILDASLYPLYRTVCEPENLRNPALFEFFQSVGFLFKKNFTQPSGEICLKDVIGFGIETYLKYRAHSPTELYNIYKDPKLVVELYYYITAITQVTNGCTLQYYIWKDTTCSMAQHAGKLLGYNLDKLAYLNLANQTTAIDTYQIFIVQLKRLLVTANPELWRDPILQLLDRSLLKKLIMTVEYGVSRYTASEEFRHTVDELSTLNPDYNVLKDPKYFDALFKAMQGGGLDLFFYQTTKKAWSKKILDSRVDKMILDDITIPIPYYYNLAQQIYFEHPNSPVRKRSVLSVQFSVIDNFASYQKLCRGNKKTSATYEDVKKSAAAVYVNAIHALDAAYLRRIISSCWHKNIAIATIHDGFAIPYDHSLWLISTANTNFFPVRTSNLTDPTLNCCFKITSNTIIV